MGKFDHLKYCWAQLAVWFQPHLAAGNEMKIAQAVSAKLGEMLPKTPFIFPPVAATPPEVPRIVWQSPDNRYSAEVCLSRARIKQDARPKEDRPAREGMDAFMTLADDFLTTITTSSGATPIRLGVIISMYLPTEENPTSYLARNYLRDTAPRDADELELTLLHHPTWTRGTLNRLFRVKSHQNCRNMQGRCLEVQIDVNTPPDSKSPITDDAMKEFLGSTREQFVASCEEILPEAES